MPFENLRDPEFQAKLRDAKTPEELLEIAREKASSSLTSRFKRWQAA